MVNFYKADKKVAAPKALEVQCDSLDILGRGVCKKDGIVYFVDNLLPQEVARIVPIVNKQTSKEKNKDNVFEAKVSKYLTLSEQRREQSCPLQDQCGGCPLEHAPCNMVLDAKVEGVSKLFTKSVYQGTKNLLTPKASVSSGTSKFGKNSTIKQVLAAKQAAKKNAKVSKDVEEKAQNNANSIEKPAFVQSSAEIGYRRVCRLAIRADHGRMFLGFREEKNQSLVPVSQCEVLTDRINAIIPKLQDLVNKVSAYKNIGHVELLDSDGALGVLFRMTCKLDPKDEAILVKFAQENQVVFSVLEPFKQLDDTEVVRERILNEEDASSMYVTAGDCKIVCTPSSFVQVNRKMNDFMISTIMQELPDLADMKVLDLFCGLGNFSLPLAKANAQVVGIDIVSQMIARANDNARANNIDEKHARFFVADLEEPFESQLWAKDQYDLVIMDPGRMGAKRAVTFMSKLKPKKIIMISCNPLAASRDIVQLVQSKYRLVKWGAVDMFPRTRHIEIMSFFEAE